MLLVESLTCHTSFGMKVFFQQIPWSANLLQILSCTQSTKNENTDYQYIRLAQNENGLTRTNLPTIVCNILKAAFKIFVLDAYETAFLS